MSPLTSSAPEKERLLLGAGGAARGALLPFLAEQPAVLVIADRTVAKAQALVDMVRQNKSSDTQVMALGFDALHEHRFDVVFNATSASLRVELPPVPAAVFAPGALAYEFAYSKGRTPRQWLRN